MENLPTIPTQYAKIDVHDATTLERATAYLSELNGYLDTLTAHKEAKTKPINEALRNIRADYKPLEEALTSSIEELRSSITKYATEQAKIALQREQKILEDKRTNLSTKIQQLSKIKQPSSKITTEKGSITFITVKKYRITDVTKIPYTFLMVDDAKVREAMKETPQLTIEGIEWYEEQSVRNYR